MKHWILALSCAMLLAACGAARSAPPQPGAAGGKLNVVAVETFLADIAQNVAGDRLKVIALLPIGLDVHGFEPAPTDLAEVASSNVLIISGTGLEDFLDKMIRNVGGKRLIVEASAGLQPRAMQPGEAPSDHEQGDPHFWLDPVKVITYVQNIRDGLSEADPAGAATYAANADAYIKKLNDLDGWIKEQVKAIPQQNRMLVTNHESLGYFADRYDFAIVGTILASVSSTASPSAQELAQLVTHIKATGVKAIFLETGTNPQLANQIAQDTGVKVVPDLYTHSVSKGGPAPTYIDMMKYNTTVIVNALR